MTDRSLKIYQGEDLSPVTDLTEMVKWEEAEFGTRAFRGESTNSNTVIRDEFGETGNAHGLPDGLTSISLATGNVLEYVHGSNVRWRGRMAAKDYSRGAREVGRYREAAAYLEDINIDLRHIVVHGWSRPAETDVARIQGLIARYLSGNPRATTKINGSNLVNSGSNTVSLPAKTYDQTDPQSVIEDVAQQANKTFFLLPRRRTSDAHTAELFYDGNDAVMERCPYSITDRPEEVKASPGHYYFPIWNVGPASTENGQELISGIYLFYGESSYVYLNDPVRAAEYEWREIVVHDGDITTQAEATARAQSILDARKNEERTYSVTIGPLNDAQLGSIRAGQTIAIKARAIPDADDQYVDRRISQLKETSPVPGTYFVHLQLDRPLRTEAAGTGTPVGPKPPTQPTAGSAVRLYPSLHLAGAADTAESAASPDLGSGNRDGGWEHFALGAFEYYQCYDAPSNTTNGTATWDATNASAGQAAVRGLVKRLSGALLTHLKSGGPVRMQARARSRFGVGIDESTQNNTAAWGIRVYRPSTGTFVGTALSVQSGGSSAFPAQSTYVNRVWSATTTAVAGAVEGDYVIIEVGANHITPTSGGTGASISFTDTGGVGNDLPEDESSTAIQNTWVEFTGSGTGGHTPSPTVEPGNESPGTNTDVYSPIDHSHAHGFLADDGIHYHDADHIAGLDETPASNTVTLSPSGDSPVTVVNDSAYNAFPGIARMANGNLILVYRVATDHFTTHDGKIVRKISTDDGATWGTAADIINPTDDARDPEVTVLRDGTVIVSYFEWDGSSAYQNYSIRSTDNGSTWDTKVAASSSFSVEANPSKIVELPDGDLLMPGYGNSGSGNYTAFLLRSSDGGDTWGSQTTIASGTIGDGDNWTEPYILRLTDGRLLCLIREDTDRDIYATYSDDDGATWETPAKVFDGWAKPFVMETAAGALLCVTRSQESSEHAIYRVSWDYGVTWEDELELETVGTQMDYASAVQVGERIIVAYSIISSTTNADIFVADLLDVTDQRFSNASHLSVTEEDGSPIAYGVSELRFSNGSVTANADGSVSIAAGGGGGGALDDLTDATITAPAEGDILRYDGSAWVNYSGHFRPVTHDFGSGPELVWDGDDLVMEWFD